MKTTARIIILLTVCFFGLYAHVTYSEAATINASSCSYADVTTAYNAASPGDILAIPAGNCTWTAELGITKAITIMGAGIDLTTISSTTNIVLIRIRLTSDVAVRITGIHFKNSTNLDNIGGKGIAVMGKMDGSFPLTQIRIDHNKFEKGRFPVYWSGWAYGVIDNNQFLNCNVAINVTGDNNYSWARPIAAGTANALFIEDNTFIVNNETDQEPNEQIYHQEGARSVVRYNTMDGSAYTTECSAEYPCGSYFFDSHDNQNTRYVGDGSEFRGQPIIEAYSNDLTIHAGQFFHSIRGGSGLFYNNKMTWAVRHSEFAFWERDAWEGEFFGPDKTYPLMTEWPAEDQITNFFLWGNLVRQGTGAWSDANTPGFNIRNSECTSDVTPYVCCTGSETGTCSDFFIQQDRDYFLHAPCGASDATDAFGNTCSHGEATYSGAGNQSLNSPFVATGNNAYYPYTPYTYPHPLSAPSPPVNLRIQ